MPYGRFRRFRTNRRFRRGRRNYARSRRYYKGYFTRRRNNRRANRNKVVTRYGKGPIGLPDKLRLKLKYRCVYQHNGASLMQITRIRGNGPYDPEVDIGGQQPVGWDQWQAFYIRYRTLGCAISVRFVPHNSNPVGVDACIYPELDGAQTPNNMQGANLQPFARSRLIATVGANPTVVKNYMSTAKMFGQDVSTDDRFQSTMDTLPDFRWNWNICTGPLFLTDPPSVVDFEVIVKYYLTLETRQTIDVS